MENKLRKIIREEIKSALRESTNTGKSSEDVYEWTLWQLSKTYSQMSDSAEMESAVMKEFGWNDDIESEAWRAWEENDKHQKR